MMACWNADPHQRPEFKMIRESLIKMLFDKVRGKYMVHAGL